MSNGGIARTPIRPLHPAAADPAHLHDRELHEPGADGIDPEVLLHQMGAPCCPICSGDSRAQATFTGVRRW